MRGAVLALTLASALAACATPYQPASGHLGGGYEEKQIGGAVWRVEFAGNPDTTHETAQTYWLYRCAELTIEQGFDGFEILSRVRLLERTDHSVRLAASTPLFVPMPGGASGANNSLRGDIRLLKKPFDPAPGYIYDARALKQTLAKYVTGEKCSRGNVCPHLHSYIYGRGAAPQTGAAAR